MPLDWGLMDLAHLGWQQVEPTRFATGVENWPKQLPSLPAEIRVMMDWDAIGPGFDGFGSPGATTDRTNLICNGCCELTIFWHSIVGHDTRPGLVTVMSATATPVTSNLGNGFEKTFDHNNNLQVYWRIFCRAITTVCDGIERILVWWRSPAPNDLNLIPFWRLTSGRLIDSNCFTVLPY
jgi:hypothetical protein